MHTIYKRASASFILLFLFHCVFAETYYISPGGDDIKGNGTRANPWRSLFKATSSVSTPGDIIRVLPGIYTEGKTCILAVGVNITGEGGKSVIRSAITEEWMPVLSIRSPEGTNGRQQISGLTFDGQNLSAFWAIVVAGRSNVSINHCIVRDFRDRGVIFDGRADNKEAPPGKYATGNSFHDNIITNCAAYNTPNGIYGRGCLNIGGQDGMLIYNNTISQEGRPDGYNGYPIKYSNDGYLKNIKIHHNKIIKKPFAGSFGGDGGWDFAIELWNIEGGVEIYKNIIQGSTDIVSSGSGKYGYGVWFHDNTILQEKISRHYESGIIFEFSNEGVIIERNIFSNISGCILFYAQKNSRLSNIVIHKNIMLNIGRENGAGNKSKGILFDCGNVSEKDTHFIASNIDITENVLVPASNLEPLFGVEISGPRKVSNLNIQGNRFENFLTSFLVINPAAAVDSMYVKDNILSGNGMSNNPLFINGAPTNYINADNVTKRSVSFPGRKYNIKQQLLRPLYYEAKELNRMIFTAWCLLVLSFIFAAFASSLAFIFGLIGLSVMATVYFENNLAGTAALTVGYIGLCIYGWRFWQKSPERIRDSEVKTTGPVSHHLLILFAGSWSLIYLSFLYLARYFHQNIFPVSDSLSYAAAFTGTWLLAKRKKQCWYFWMVATFVSALAFYQKSLLIPAFFCACVFILSLWGLYQWSRHKPSIAATA